MGDQHNVTKFFNLLLHICLVLVLSACGGNDNGANPTEAITALPQSIQQVAALNIANGNLEAWITIDNEPPTQMQIDSDMGMAVTTITVSRSIHSVLIEFVFTDGVDTVTLATAIHTVDLSAGDATLALTDADYTTDYDNDGDGKTNLDEIIDGTDPLLPDAPAITITDSVVPNDDLNIPFGSVTVGSTAEQTVTVTNDGAADLVLGTLGGTDPLATPFSILNDNCSGQTLASAANCSVTVRFDPATVGIWNDNFDIPSNDPDPDEVFVTVSVSGTGDSVPVPDITVTDSAAPIDDLSVSFGSEAVGSTAEQTVTITNDGAADLILGTLGGANPLAVPFSILNDTCSGQTLAPAANCSVTVRFAPGTEGIYHDSFDIPSNDPDPDEAPVTVSVSGEGAQAITIDVTSGTSGTYYLNQSFNETRAVDISTPFSLVVTSMTLNEFNTLTTGTVGARIYNNDGSLRATANVDVSSGFDQSVTIPISTILNTGDTYRIGFFIDAGGSGGSGDFFDPTPAGLSLTPYDDLTGTIQITGAFQSVSDAYPTTTNSYVPLMTIEVLVDPILQ